MDRPKANRKIITGTVNSSVPVDVKPSTPARCPCWKAHTVTPRVAPMDSRFITTALMGRTTLPVKSHNRTRVAPNTKPNAIGSR